MERRLVAILAADVVGYTRLMEADEAGTLAKLNSHREELVHPTIAKRHGRIVKLMGDGALVEFGSVVDAVECAVEIQQGMSERNAKVPENWRIDLRIGINVGDVIVEGDDIYGDGVNVAARLEALAEPGGICLSGDTYRQVRGKIEAIFEDMGERRVKNIAEPLRVYRVAAGATGEADSNGASDNSLGIDFSLPDYPSIAVLPFTVMSADPEQEFFSDGITEDITTALSKINSLLVVARNSTFTYKGKAVDVKQVSREQGVRYVLEGSVRKAGNKVRITAQLINATTGMHLWAERYDRELEDIFAIQDEITHEVVIALDVRLSAGEQARVWSSGTNNLEAWVCARQGIELTNRGTPESVREALKLCERALALDPDYAFGWVVLGWTHHHRVDVSVGPASEEDRLAALRSASDCAGKALELDPFCADAYALSSFCHLSRRNYEMAISRSEKSVDLAPGNAEILGIAAMLQLKSGRPERALELIKMAIRLCPVNPVWFCSVLGNTYRALGHNESAIAAFESAIKRGEEFLAVHVGLASLLGELGRQEKAKKCVSELLRIDPGFSIKRYMSGLSYSNSAVMDRFKDGLQKAGLPD
jgi:adenylate cyclase